MVNMTDRLKSAVILSIISTPSKLGLWNEVTLPPGEILRGLNPVQRKVQEIIKQKYSGDTDKVSDLIIESCIRKKIRIITIWDSDYPQMLKEIHNPPLVLYSSGNIRESRMISIVGTRNSDVKSEEITRKISGRASLMGFTVVSGMASGIDRNAHLGALTAGGGTIAVLPGGTDMVYPYKNSDIYRMISESQFSGVVSEYPPGIGTAQKWTFARRNRIISGLSEAVIVVQAPLKSGAMITARYAVEQNRDLYVCPGNAFDDNYSGCNELIKQGASLFSDMNDFFTELSPGSESPGIQSFEKRESKNLEKPATQTARETEIFVTEEFTGKVELKIIEELKTTEIVIDEFLRRNNFSADEMNQGITVLEIAGYISRKGSRLCKL